MLSNYLIMKRLLPFQWLGYYLLLVPLSLTAQENIVISGQVMDIDGEKPLTGVNVVLKSNLVGTTTNAEGRFTLFTVAERLPLILVVSRPSYGKKEVIVQGATDILIVRLKRNGGDLPWRGQADPEGVVQNNIGQQRFASSTNADGTINTHGFAIGVNYALPQGFILGIGTWSGSDSHVSAPWYPRELQAPGTKTNCKVGGEPMCLTDATVLPSAALAGGLFITYPFPSISS